MTDATPAEITRRLERLEDNTVLSAVYDRDMKELRLDVAEIKKGTNRLVALVITETLALLVAIVLLLLNVILEGRFQ